MSEPGKIIIALSFFGSLTYTVRFLAQQLIGARHADPRPELRDDRLARLEQAVESIAIEVERISEGQRFTTRLLAERAQADQLRDGSQPLARSYTNPSH